MDFSSRNTMLYISCLILLVKKHIIEKKFSLENKYFLLLRYSKRVLPSLPWNIIINHFLENRGRAALLAKCKETHIKVTYRFCIYTRGCLTFGHI